MVQVQWPVSAPRLILGQFPLQMLDVVELFSSVPLVCRFTSSFVCCDQWIDVELLGAAGLNATAFFQEKSLSFSLFDSLSHSSKLWLQDFVPALLYTLQ